MRRVCFLAAFHIHIFSKELEFITVALLPPAQNCLLKINRLIGYWLLFLCSYVNGYWLLLFMCSIKKQKSLQAFE